MFFFFLSHFIPRDSVTYTDHACFFNPNQIPLQSTHQHTQPKTPGYYSIKENPKTKREQTTKNPVCLCISDRGTTVNMLDKVEAKVRQLALTVRALKHGQKRAGSKRRVRRGGMSRGGAAKGRVHL